MRAIATRIHHLERHYRPEATTLVVRWHIDDPHIFKEDITVTRWLGAETIVLNVVYDEPIATEHPAGGG